MTSTTSPRPSGLTQFIKSNRGILISIVGLILLPFILTLVDGQSISSMLANESGQSKFYQGLAIEIFILAIYALSYDLLFGITGLLSFGHAMFYGVGAYLTGIMLKSFGWGLLPIIGLVTVAGVVMALIFSIVLPRVKGITFALVTLGIAQVFYIVIQSRELVDFAGAEIGLQGVTPPEFLNPVEQRLRFYFVGLAILFVVYFIYKRFVDSPTGRVCIAIRENEDRATMLGFNTFYFKLAALTLSSVTAALAGAMHGLFHPIIRPGIASSHYTIAALLMILIGGIGTLNGAILGAATFRLLSFYLEKLFGGTSQVIIGIVYILLVLFLPYGIVGTWKLRGYKVKQGWKDLVNAIKSNS
ncbi:MAG: branched-chain amino acid ABC transporter permease [Chloroflexi bacterium]|jgi:branched-chain amino acid transport system permease protein|nr:branched-chain amino acid ABC transporter permease [Chloroflexota bacterium]